MLRSDSVTVILGDLAVIPRTRLSNRAVAALTDEPRRSSGTAVVSVNDMRRALTGKDWTGSEDRRCQWTQAGVISTIRSISKMPVKLPRSGGSDIEDPRGSHPHKRPYGRAYKARNFGVYTPLQITTIQGRLRWNDRTRTIQ